MKKFLRKEGGFTLIELLVVILILAILIAIAVPSFLNQTKKAQKRSACSDNANAFRALSAWATTYNGAYDGGDGPGGIEFDLAVEEPSLTETNVNVIDANSVNFDTDRGSGSETLDIEDRADNGNGSCSL